MNSVQNSHTKLAIIFTRGQSQTIVIDRDTFKNGAHTFPIGPRQEKILTVENSSNLSARTNCQKKISKNDIFNLGIQFQVDFNL